MKTDKVRQLPPFSTQIIGSLPRSQVVLDLLSSKESLTKNEFNQRMDEMVIFAIRLQEQAGLDVVSDGEWRRVHYADEFLNRIGGFERVREFRHQGEVKLTDVVVSRFQRLIQSLQRMRNFLSLTPGEPPNLLCPVHFSLRRDTGTKITAGTLTRRGGIFSSAWLS